MIANTMSWAFYVSLINIALTPKIFAADAIFDQLENNFDLAKSQRQPERNHQCSGYCGKV